MYNVGYQRKKSGPFFKPFDSFEAATTVYAKVSVVGFKAGPNNFRAFNVYYHQQWFSAQYGVM